MNYRRVQEENHKKTRNVMILYIVIFLCIGLLADTIFNVELLTNNPNMGLLTAMGITFNEIISLQRIPMISLIMGGISLLIIWIAIKFGNKLVLAGNEYVRIDNKENKDQEEEQLINIVEELVISSRLRYKPEVYIIEADYMNAFASGWKEENSLVAITRGLMNKLTRSEIEAVMAHEMAHIKNADVRLTLVVGILTNVMLFVVDRLFYSTMGRGGNSKAAQQARIVILVLQIILPILTIVLQMYLSRTREYLADSGATEFTGNPEALATALEKISGDYDYNKYEDDNKTRNAAYIFSPTKLFSTHPPIEERIAALRNKKRRS